MLVVSATSVLLLALLDGAIGTQDTAHWPWNPDRMGDGCKHVFVDIGANIGVHTRFLFESAFYPGPMQSKFTPIFGEEVYRSLPSVENGICSFSIEANPLHEKRQHLLEKCYLARGHRVKVFSPMAASDDDTQSMYFRLQENDIPVQWGGQVWTQHQMDKLRSTYGKTDDTFTEVKSLDVAAFIAKHIKDRVYDKTAGEGKVMLKIDIEGSEFRVLPSIERSSLLCKGIVDLIVYELHPLPDLFNHTKFSKRFKHKIQNFSGHFDSVTMRKSLECPNPTDILQFDSEAYLFDKEHPLEETCSGIGRRE
jgi:hypothetical protein